MRLFICLIAIGFPAFIATGITFSILESLFEGEHKEKFIYSFFYDLSATPYHFCCWAFRKTKTKQTARKPTVADIEWEKKQNEIASAAKTKKQRIEKARFDVQLLYDRNSSQIANKFPAAKLSKYFEDYMGDELDTETVEQRGLDLQEMILSLTKPTQKKKKVVTAETIRAHYARLRNQLESLDLELDAKEGQLAELNYQEDQALSDYHRNS